MLTAEAASLAISISRGLIKLGGRLDLLLAERTAVDGPLVIPMPSVSKPALIWPRRVAKLKQFLKETEGATPDPLGADRPKLARLLAQDPVPDEADRWFSKLFPDLAQPAVIDPDAEYLLSLRNHFPTIDWSDTDTRLAAFQVAAGRDDRGLGYAARVGLLVADVVAEFGAENTALFVRDPQVRSVVQSVLTRFAEPDLERFDEWSPFLRHALGATLNGIVDARAQLDGGAEWLDALLGALAQARAESEHGDDYLLGLLRGRGYGLLIRQGLLKAGERLNADDAPAFQSIAAQLLIESAPLVREDARGFADFFHEHWGDLLRGGLKSLEQHGPVLLSGKSPALQVTLGAMIGELARTPDRAFLSGEVLFRATEAALGAVAARPDLLKDGAREEWFRELISGLAGTVGSQGVRETFTRNGVGEVLQSALEVMSDHPEMLGMKPGIHFELVGGILKAAGAADSLDARTIANAAVGRSLRVLADHPELVDSRYSKVTTDFVAQLAGLVEAKTLSRLQAVDLIDAGSSAVRRNPMLFAASEKNVTSLVVQAVLKGSEGSPSRLLKGAALTATVRGILQALAPRGRDWIDSASAKQLTNQLAAAVSAGLIRAEKELGRRLDLPALPSALAGVAAALAQGDATVLDPEHPRFKELFAQLAGATVQRTGGTTTIA